MTNSHRNTHLFVCLLQNNAAQGPQFSAFFSIDFEVRHPRCVSNKSVCNVYTICRQTQLSTRWYATLLNLNNYMFRPQSLAIIRLYKRKLIN